MILPPRSRGPRQQETGEWAGNRHGRRLRFRTRSVRASTGSSATRRACRSLSGGPASSWSSARDAGRAETLRRTGLSKPTVWRWWDRVKAGVALAMSPPPEHARHGTLRALAAAMGDRVISPVRNILLRHGLRPHPVKTFKVARDPKFAIKVRDVVGRDVGRTVERHRSEEFLAVRDPVAAGIAPETPVHVIRDNVSSHKSVEVHAWLKGRPNWTFHVTPTAASWMNAVEGSSRN